MTKLYTKRGDAGQTDLFGGQRIDKDSLRVEAYGTVDELNSTLGLADAACHDTRLTEILRDSQARLFELGADLATPRQEGKPDAAGIPRIAASHIDVIEQQIDEISDRLPPMTHFIMPGGCDLAARLHMARTVCRRAERICVHLKKHEPVSDEIIIYLNRLSDLLFALARRANQVAGVADVPWLGPRGK